MGYVTLQAYGCTDIGEDRLRNEDYLDMNDFSFVLADGMGGHNAGDIASRSAVNSFMKCIDDINDLEFNESSNETKIQQTIDDAIKKTNESVFNKSRQQSNLQGMGTTLVLALFQQPNTIHIANVGDSRAYLLRNNTLELLTEDHSITASMARDGTITELEAENHPFRHHLTRSIGTSEKVEAFTDFFQVKPNDKILLCSDGLWDVLSDEEICDSLKMNCPPEETCKNLINKAKKRKSKDNISSIVLSVSTA